MFLEYCEYRALENCTVSDSFSSDIYLSGYLIRSHLIFWDKAEITYMEFIIFWIP